MPKLFLLLLVIVVNYMMILEDGVRFLTDRTPKTSSSFLVFLMIFISSGEIQDGLKLSNDSGLCEKLNFFLVFRHLSPVCDFSRENILNLRRRKILQRIILLIYKGGLLRQNREKILLIDSKQQHPRFAEETVQIFQVKQGGFL